jgi:glutaredoxin
MPGGKEEVHWAAIQEKVFTRWCNDYLSERGMAIQDLKTDLKNGLLLCNLIEIISGKSLGRINKHPTIPIQKLENLQLAIDHITKVEGIKLVNVGAEDIHSGNLRIILGLIWTLILRFEIKAGGDGSDAGNDLLRWIQSKIPEYNITGFTKDWNDGRAICALTNAMSPGLISDHKSAGDPLQKATQGIDTAYKNLGVDPLIHAEEMIHPKVDKMAMMCYLAQFRNIKPEDMKKASDASLSSAWGPGLVEGIANQDALFTVQLPDGSNSKLEVKVEGPNDKAKVNVKKNPDGTYGVSYLPTTPGAYRVHVLVGGEHIPGSIFDVMVLESESLGGEGKIRVFFSTTSSSEKSKRDRFALETLLQQKKVHLRHDFEPWIAVDICEKEDRDAIFRKAGTRNLPIVFVDDKYVGDYDALMELESNGKLDALLAMQGVKLVSESEHMARLKSHDQETKAPAASGPGAAAQVTAAAKTPAPAPKAAGGGGGGNKCAKCGAAKTGAKFCAECGNKH